MIQQINTNRDEFERSRIKLNKNVTRTKLESTKIADKNGRKGGTKKIRDLAKESRNQAQENRVTVSAQAEQA
jgi:hypothetical protein